jgi:hypothetical protein
MSPDSHLIQLDPEAVHKAAGALGTVLGAAAAHLRVAELQQRRHLLLRRLL